MATGPYGNGGLDPRESIGQPDSMRNEEQRLRDNEGGSELTDRPDDHPAGVPGETASAEAAGPPPNLADAGSHLSDADYQRNPADARRDQSEAARKPAEAERNPTEADGNPIEAGRSLAEARSNPAEAGHNPAEAGHNPAEAGSHVQGEEMHRGDNAKIGAPVRSAGPSETTLPEESPLREGFQPGGASADEVVPPSPGDRKK